MSEQYHYYNCLVPEALKLASRSNSEEDYPPSPPPRPPKSLSQRSFDIPARDYYGNHSRTQSFEGGNFQFSPPARLTEVSPQWKGDVDQQFVYREVESPPPMPPRSQAWQYSREVESQDIPFTRDTRDYTNTSPGGSPRLLNSSPVMSDDQTSVRAQFSPGVGAPKTPSYYNNQSTYSDPSPAVSQLSPGLPERSQRRHTIDNNFPMPLVLQNDSISALPQRSPVSPVSGQTEHFSDTGSCETSPALPQRSPRKPPKGPPSYEYPQSSPRHHEYHQVKNASLLHYYLAFYTFTS